MDENERLRQIEEFESASEESRRAPYLLRLYITGSTPNSMRALQNIRGICEQYLAGRYELEIVDLYQQPHRASQDEILAIPTLVRREPGPLRRVIGDLSNASKVLMGLEIPGY